MGSKFSPLGSRILAYDEVRKLAREGVKSPSCVMRRLSDSGFTVPPRETTRRWILGFNSPITNLNVFFPRPSNELSFFIGAWYGDGWGDESDGGKRLRLKVRSGSFAQEFADAANEILHKSVPYKVWATRDEGGLWYNVKVTSLMLYEFVNQGFRRLREVIEMSPVGFVRGFSTAEGCPSVSVAKRRGPRLEVGIAISNSDLELLRSTAKLLSQLGIRSGKVRMNHKEGQKTNLGVATRPGWLLNISGLADVEKFALRIGFADVEKQEKLADALGLLRRFGPRGAARRWPRLYKKNHRKWKRESSS